MFRNQHPSPPDGKTAHDNENNSIRAHYNTYIDEYIERYKDKINLMVFYSVITLLLNTKKILLKDNIKLIKLIDYGCGDGRLYSVFKHFSKKFLQSQGIQLEVTGVDPSDGMLNQFKNKLLTDGFEEIATTDKANFSRKYATLYNQKSNIKVHLINKHERDSIKEETTYLGEYHCGICIFGVLSHIMEREQRVAIMKMLGNKVKYQTLYTLPNHRRVLLKEQKSHYYFFKRKIPVNGRILMERDIFYTRGKTHEIRLPYHLYSAEEINQDLEAAGLHAVNGLQISNLLDETLLTKTKNSCIANLDKLVCNIVPPSLVPIMAKYFLILTEKYNPEHKLLNQPVRSTSWRAKL